MEMTTIAISKDLKKKISEFGTKGETFSDILARLYANAQKRLLHDLLFNEEGCVPVRDALKRAKTKWQK